MISMAIWLTAIFLEGVLLYRGLRQGLFPRYPFFFSYIAFVFAAEFMRFYAFRADDRLYFDVYWSTQFLSLVIGSAVFLDLYRVGLRSYPGTARMARATLLIVFAFLLARTLATRSVGIFQWFHQQSEQLELSLRMVQCIALFALVLLCVWYAVSLGKNLRGIVFGYGVFICLIILQLTAVTHFGAYLQTVWSYLQPCSYLVVLSLWLEALWVADENLPAMPNSKGGGDYSVLAASTQELLEQARERLGSAVRP